jgi:hypothetical protein
MEDTDWDDATLTVQVGSTTICNGAKMFGLAGITALSSGFSVNDSSTNGFVALSFGSHVCTQNDNVYITITASGEVTATDVSLIVDEPGVKVPLRITEYSDNVFTSPNNLASIAYDAGKAAIEEDTSRVTIRNAVESSSPTFTASASYWNANCISNAYHGYFGLLNQSQVPLTTTYNYVPSVADRIITLEQMGTSSKAVSQARRNTALVMSQAGK